MAKGYHQVEGIDFTESFSLVAKAVIVRVVLAMAVTRGWQTHQININNAYLHGTLEEEVYMTPPLSYNKTKSGQVCRLKRSLYGLKHTTIFTNRVYIFNSKNRQTFRKPLLFNCL